MCFSWKTKAYFSEMSCYSIKGTVSFKKEGWKSNSHTQEEEVVMEEELTPHTHAHTPQGFYLP